MSVHSRRSLARSLSCWPISVLLSGTRCRVRPVCRRRVGGTLRWSCCLFQSQRRSMRGSVKEPRSLAHGAICKSPRQASSRRLPRQASSLSYGSSLLGTRCESFCGADTQPTVRALAFCMENADLWARHLALYRRADALYKNGEIKEAKRLFLRALSLAPRDADTLWAIGSCFSDLGRPAAAERYYRRARAVARWHQRGDILYNIANALLDQGRPLAALRLYRRVPRSSSAYLLSQRNAALAKRRANPSFQRTASGRR